MKLKEKANIITFIGIVLILINLLAIVLYDFSIRRVIMIAISIVIIVIAKTKKNLFPEAALFGLMGILEVFPGLLIISMCGLISSFMRADDEVELKTFIKKNPILASIVIGISGISIISYSALINYCAEYTYGAEAIAEFAACVGLAIIIYLCHKYKFIIRNEVTFFEMIKITLPIWLFYLISGTVQIFSNIYSHPLQSNAYIILLVLNFMLVGLFEEFLLRGIVLNILIDKFNKNRKSIWFAVILSSLIFGLAHYMNLSTGASFFGVTIQVISAFTMGVYLAAVYLRTRNIWYNALLHGLWDVVASLSLIFVGNEMGYGDIISGYNAMMLIPAVFYIIFALFVLRKKKILGVIAKINNQEYHEKEKPKTVTVQRVFAGITVAFTFMAVAALIYDFKQIDVTVESTFENLPKYYNGEKYIFTDDFKDEDLTEEMKLYMVAYSLDEKTNEDFTITDEGLSLTYKKLFNKELKEHIEFNYTDEYDCVHENKEYVCTYIGPSENNIKVYSSIKSYNTDGTKVTVEVYYLITDLNTNRVYGDSSLENLVYVGDLNNLTKAKYNEKSNYNPEFFEELNKYFDIPVYVLDFETSSTMDTLAFKGISTKENKLDITVDYTPTDITRTDYNNKTIFKIEDDSYLEIKSISQVDYMEKIVNTTPMYIDNNRYYYNYLDEVYLINTKDNYYSIRVEAANANAQAEFNVLLGSIEI